MAEIAYSYLHSDLHHKKEDKKARVGLERTRYTMNQCQQVRGYIRYQKKEAEGRNFKTYIKDCVESLYPEMTDVHARARNARRDMLMDAADESVKTLSAPSRILLVKGIAEEADDNKKYAITCNNIIFLTPNLIPCKWRKSQHLLLFNVQVDNIFLFST